MKRRRQTVTHWGAYYPVVRDGKLIEMSGFDIDPHPSPIGQNMVGCHDHATRISKPSIRKGFYENGLRSDTTARGAQAFVEVSWEQAEQIVSDVLAKTRRDHGNESIYAGSYGWASAGKFHHAPSQLHRFLNCFGGFTFSKNSYSFAAAEVIVGRVMGRFHPLLVNVTSWPSIIEHADTMVAFGGMPVKNGQVEYGGCARHVQESYMRLAGESDLKIVSVSPIRDDSHEALDVEWMPIVPNTDVAMMLGLAHSIVSQGLHDAEFLERYCTGFDVFSAYLNGSADGVPKSPAWASSICGIPADDIESLATRMATGRTMISVSWSLTRQEHGEQPYWMAIALASIIGQIGLPGGGVGFGYCATNGVGNNVGRVRWNGIPTGANPVSTFIPVARFADMLLNPGAKFDYDGESLTYPEIRVVYWAGGNPFHHHQDINRLIKAWKKPECVIIHDPFWTSAARHSDIVLPATTALERDDISASPRDSFIVRMDQALPRHAEARNDHDIFAAIAKRLGLEDEFTEGRTEEEWHRHLYEESCAPAREIGVDFPSYEHFVETGMFEVKPPENPTVLLQPFRANPERHPLRTPSGKIELHSELIASFGYDDCPGHPTWLEPSEWLGSARRTDRHYHLISNQPAARLHSQLDCGAYSLSRKENRREPIRMHPNDAGKLGIVSGDTVRVYNGRGAFYATAALDCRIVEGVMQVATGAWYDPVDPALSDTPCRHGNPNVVTHDRGTSKLAQGPAALSCLVQVEKALHPVPDVSIFEPPPIELPDSTD